MRLFFLILVVAGVVGWEVWQQLQTHESRLKEEQVMEVFGKHAEELRKHPDVLGLFPGPDHIVIITDWPNVVPKEVEGIPVRTEAPPPHLPPPPGVIVLKEDGTTEHQPEADACPRDHHEVKIYRWRFCNPVYNPQTIPGDMMTPPIAGIPYREAKAIHERNVGWIMQLPGVMSAGLGSQGIEVLTSRLELLPSFVEDLPVIGKDSTGLEARGVNHT